jgi:deoxyribodipyrimidine photolyase-related protein
MIVILPTQLFWPNNLIQKNKSSRIFLVEHPVYFTMYDYHKMKLVLHRSTMKCYYERLKNQGFNVKYINFSKFGTFKGKLKKEKVMMYYPEDHAVSRNMKNICGEIKFYESPMFLAGMEDLKLFNKKYPRAKHSTFYSWQKNKLDKYVNESTEDVKRKIAMFQKTKSQDKNNRHPFPKEIREAQKFKNNNSPFVTEAINYVETYFSKNPGITDTYLPITHEKTRSMAKKFLKDYLPFFGKYQDAVSSNVSFGFHSVLSPLMNIGLITPKQMLKLFFDIPINFSLLEKSTSSVGIESAEGYLRQLIGWREYTRYHYIFNREKLEKNNIFRHENKLNNEHWYHNPEKSRMPKVIIDLIQKTIQTGYLHHIERLMYIGNYLLLSKIHPKQVFLWFQSMFLDSYHVFMYPNVYGMSQYSCGSVMMTRPYFSSANYIEKMSDYDVEDEWNELYRKFVIKNKAILLKNYAAAYQVKNVMRKIHGSS